MSESVRLSGMSEEGFLVIRALSLKILSRPQMTGTAKAQTEKCNSTPDPKFKSEMLQVRWPSRVQQCEACSTSLAICSELACQCTAAMLRNRCSKYSPK